MAEILIPEPLRDRVRTAPTHWDVYIVSVLLKDGRVFRNLAAPEGMCITGFASNTGVVSSLPFSSNDIVDVEPHYPPMYNALTFLSWLLGRAVYVFRPSSAASFRDISWAPRRRF